MYVLTYILGCLLTVFNIKICIRIPVHCYFFNPVFFTNKNVMLSYITPYVIRYILNRQAIVAALVGHCSLDTTGPNRFSSVSTKREVQLGIQLLCYLTSRESNQEMKYKKKEIRVWVENYKKITSLVSNSNQIGVIGSSIGTLPSFRSSSNRTSSLRNFISFIKTLLEDVSKFEENQLRLLFAMIFQCGSNVIEEPSNGYENEDDDEDDGDIMLGSNKLVGDKENDRFMSNRQADSAFANTDTETSKAVKPTKRLNSIPKRPISSLSPPDDVLILLKKFLGSINLHYRKIAIIGFVSFLIELRRFNHCCTDEDKLWHSLLSVKSAKSDRKVYYTYIIIWLIYRTTTFNFVSYSH